MIDDFFGAGEFYKHHKFDKNGVNFVLFNGGSRDYCNNTLTIGMQRVVREINEAGIYCDVAYIPQKSHLNYLKSNNRALCGYYSRKRGLDEFLPWEFVKTRFSKEQLKKFYMKKMKLVGENIEV